MEIFWSCCTSWGSSLWNVSLSMIDCYTAFSAHLPPPTPKEGRIRQLLLWWKQGRWGWEGKEIATWFALVLSSFTIWDGNVRLLALPLPRSFVEGDHLCLYPPLNLKSPELMTVKIPSPSWRLLPSPLVCAVFLSPLSSHISPAQSLPCSPTWLPLTSPVLGRHPEWGELVLCLRWVCRCLLHDWSIGQMS